MRFALLSRTLSGADHPCLREAGGSPRHGRIVAASIVSSKARPSGGRESKPGKLLFRRGEGSGSECAVSRRLPRLCGLGVVKARRFFKL